MKEAFADQVAQAAESNGQRYVIVSTDDHAGPRPSVHLRDYCPPQFLEAFDEECREQDRVSAEHDLQVEAARARIAAGTGTVSDLSLDELGKCRDAKGHDDPHARLADMDGDGVAAEIIFAGGQNDTELPWVGFGWSAGPSENDELRRTSYRMWNHWLADFCSTAPERLIGVMQIPIWNIDKAIEELHWGAERGLRVVNLHAPRADYPAYTDLAYEPFWDACEEVGAVLATHAGAIPPFDPNTRSLSALIQTELHYTGNRGLPQLIWGGVFERHPKLRYVLTEQRIDFAPGMLSLMDTYYDNRVGQSQPASQGGVISPAWPRHENGYDPVIAELPRRPSDYWHDHCFLSGSFLAPYEVGLRHEVGLGNLMWASDYPHSEGTWPDTALSLRNTFATVPEPETRMILGENAVQVFGLDGAKLREVADRIGPKPEELRVPVRPEEIPLGRNFAFREQGTYA
ncbi:amidohydrolase family protein [Nocardioides sp. cx-173]|uniref:amidohydrolase family protein n=1 Tax=Nocardioides sp. cx-173 TaxID=2898796 RepID=UPI001E4AF425|nr:amidohydrolase family protein [Nocardioides sp. cx-173]MCD4524259.1 amidohydrolase [Nocardioides sp. cx-173]UGB41651.1 amidohydrolase [Nocardioides sp. cx-173]